jgi:hypothetical protein
MRFGAATTFLDSSRILLENDMIYASALADAISAIKNILQSYLYTRIAQKLPAAAPQPWQEAAASNSIPSQLDASKDAGLKIPDELYDRIKRWNRVRNRREHDNPSNPVKHFAAQDALRAAEEVQQLVRAALGISTTPAKAPVATAVAPIAPATSTSPVATATAPAAASFVAPPTLASDELEERDDDVSPATPGWGRRFLRTLGRIAAVLLLVVVGLAAGVGIMIPVASGNAPSWLGFATRLLPTPSAVQTATTSPTATPTAPSGPIILGTITVSPPVCGAGGASFQMHNVGTTSAQWAIGSPGAMEPMFALTAGATPQVALFGSLDSTSEVTVYVSGRTPVVLTTDGGAVQLTLPTC